MSPASLGYLLAFLSAAAGAVRYNLAVFARERGLPPVPFLAGALVVGLACSAGHVAARDGRRGFLPLAGRWRHALLYGALMGWGTLAHFLALEDLNEVAVTALSQTNILLTIALAVWLLAERFTRAEWAATAVIFGGVFLFRPWAAVNLRGFLILMSGVLAGAFATIGAKRWVAGIPPRVLMVWRNGVALALVGVYAAFGERPSLSLPAVLACAAAGIMGPWLHGLFFLQALERIDASKASLMNRVQPAIVFLLSWAFLSRLPSVSDRWSAALLVGGTVWLAIARRRA